MGKPKVSIIVPVYGVEKYLDRCMQSLLNQTLKEIEIIMVEDESPDNCSVMCDEYAKNDNRIKVIHKKNGGLGYARNTGLSIATGEYVAFVDSDDFVKQTMYEELYNEAIVQNADAVFCNFSTYNTKKEIYDVVEVTTRQYFKGKEEISLFLLDMVGTKPSEKKDRKYSMSVWRAIYSNDIIKSNRILFTSERDLISEDIIFHIQLLIRMKVLVYLPTCNYYYCENATSLSKSFRSDRFDKYKVLHKELILMLRMMDICDEINATLSVDRLLIGYVRSMILNSTNSMMELKFIFDDTYFREVMNRYPHKQLPFKHKLFLILANKRQLKIINLLRKI
jgi:glycosyltransferase involved in cell wall biosynthesis